MHNSKSLHTLNPHLLKFTLTLVEELSFLCSTWTLLRFKLQQHTFDFLTAIFHK